MCLKGRAAIKPAHNTGQTKHALLIGNHAISVAQFIGFLVERDKTFAIFGRPRRHSAGQLIGVINMQGPSAVVGNIIGNIDQRANRLEANRRQPRPQPSRTLGILNTLNAAGGKCRTSVALNGNHCAVIFFGFNLSYAVGL